MHRGGCVEVNAGQIESFEGAPARNHGSGDQRRVIFDAGDDDADDDDVDLELLSLRRPPRGLSAAGAPQTPLPFAAPVLREY